MKFIKKVKRFKRNVNKVKKESGWNYIKTINEMKKARNNGISFSTYRKNKCYKMTEEELQKFKEKLEKKNKNLEKCIEMICNETGWDKDRANNEIKSAKKMGISLSQYCNRACYDLNSQELNEMADIIRKQKEKLNNDKQFYINAVVKKSGWNKEKVISEMEKADEMGINYLKYVQKGCWRKNEKELDDMVRFVKANTERINKNKTTYIDKICENTGWSKGKAHLEVNKAKINCGASYEDYYVFKLYDVSHEKQKEYVTLDLFNKMRIKYNDFFKASEIFDDKAKFNETFSDLINRKWFVNRNISYEEFLEKIKDLDNVLVKPLAATQGIGIKKFKCNESDKKNKELYETLINMDISIVEEYIIQHKDVMKFCPTSVNTLRITTLNYNGECKFLYSVFRMGRGEVVDNFHAGGIAATVDIKTGKVCTDAADLEANVYPKNPYSNIKIKGFKIPNWDKIIETCQKASGKVEGVNLIGWDFAITENGVDLIEGNPGASYVVAQIPNIKDRKGLRKEMVDPYLTKEEIGYE